MRIELWRLLLMTIVVASPLWVGAASWSAPAGDLPAITDPLTVWRLDRLPSEGRLPPPVGSPQRAIPARPTTGRIPVGPFVPSDLPSPDGVPVEQVVVTSDALAASFQRFADAETRRGVPTVVRTTSWIDAHWTGLDAPARIRSFLRDAHDLWGTRWVVLGGDPEHVPTRYVPWETEEIPTDLYYECLDRDWNEDGDAVWAEPMTAAAFDGLVNDVAVGPDGRTWVATYFGVAVRDGDGFTSWGVADGLPAEHVNCVDVAPDGTVWAGTAAGIARWDGSSWRAWTTIDGLPGGWVASVDASREDDAWIGTNGGLARWDGASWHSWGVTDGLPNPFVTSVARDGEALWLGTPSGAARWDAGVFTVVRSGPDGTLSDWVSAVGVDPLGRVWLGHLDNWFADGGLSVCEGGVWTTDAFPALGGLSVRGFAFGPDPAEAWIATSAGLLHRTPSGDEMFGPGDGLPASDLYAVELVVVGGLAVGTSAGLAERRNGSWSVWGTAEGLPAAPVDYDDVDFVSDVILGRIPATDPREVDLYVDKLASYRRGLGADHADRALLLGENLFEAGDGKAYAEAAGAKLPPTYSRTGLYEIDGNQNRASVLAALNEGPGWVVSVSHGSYDVLGVGPGSELLFNRDLDGTDSGGRPAFVVVYSCNAGAFDFESSAEHLLFHPTGGAIATMANTREAVPSVDAVTNERLLEEIFASPTGRPAEAIQAVRAEQWATNPNSLRLTGWTRRGALVRSYLGAPDLPLWRSLPRDLAVSHPGIVPLARAAFQVRVTAAADGQPVAGAIVCVSKGREDWARSATDAEGLATFDFRPETLGDVDVVVSAIGFRQWEGSAAVGAAEGAHLVAEAAEVSDARSLAGVREIDFRIRLRNVGTQPSDPESVHLASADPAVRVVAGAGSLPSVAPGDVVQVGPFTVGVHRSLPDGAPFFVRLEGEGVTPFAETVRLEARAPLLRLRAVGATGDLVEPIVENVGSLATGPLEATLVPREGGGTVLVGSASSGSLGPGESRTLEGMLRVAGPATARFELRVSDGRGGAVTRVFDREAPDAPRGATHEPRDGGVLLSWEPSTAMDLEGYRVLRRTAGGWEDVFAGALLPGALAEVALDPGGSAELAIVAVDGGGLPSPDSCFVTAHAAPPTLAGWPRRLSSLVGPSPVIATDLDGDGSKEVLCGSMWEANAVNVFHTDGREWTDGDARPQTTGPFGVTGGRIHGAPLACDVDGDGRKEIFAVSFDGWAYGWRVEDGASGPPTTLPGWPVFLAAQGARSSPVAADVDGDGVPEIVTVALDGRVRVLEPDGTLAAGWPKTTHATGMGSTPAVCDLDGDGRDDLVFGGADSLLYAVSGNGLDLPGWPFRVDAKVLSSPVVADVDGDGDFEIFAMGRDGRVWSFEHDDADGAHGADLRVGWPIRLESYEWTPPSPALADFDGDGVPELVVPGTMHLAILRSDGTPFPGWPKSLGSEIVNSPVVADLDGEGGLDILVGTYDRKLHAIRVDGSSLPGWPRTLHERVWSTPFVDDVDGDGDLDVVIAADDMDVRIVDVTGPDVPGATPWPGYHGDATLAGRWTPPPLPRVLPAPDAVATMAPALRLDPPSPNPFRGTVQLRFAVPVAGRSRLEIHDVTGRRLATPLDGPLPPGSHQVVWDGRDSSGRPVASGVYFVRLVTDAGHRTTRVLRLR